jgi:hypothetical protein
MGPQVDDISPTLLTWVVSASVVVLVSALSFSAGYVVGKETGHAEAMGQIGAAGSEAGRCGKEAASGMKGAGMGLRRLRWTGGGGVRVWTTPTIRDGRRTTTDLIQALTYQWFLRHTSNMGENSLIPSFAGVIIIAYDLLFGI